MATVLDRCTAHGQVFHAADGCPTCRAFGFPAIDDTARAIAAGVADTIRSHLADEIDVRGCFCNDHYSTCPCPSHRRSGLHPMGRA